MDMPFDYRRHSPADGVHDDSGQYVAKDQMFWLIEKVRSRKLAEVATLTCIPM
jgi:hypothetical protein